MFILTRRARAIVFCEKKARTTEALVQKTHRTSLTTDAIGGAG